MNCVEAVQVREMEKSYHEYAEVRALTPFTLRCLSQNISSRVNFITFRVIFSSFRWEIWLSEISGVERWPTLVLF